LLYERSLDEDFAQVAFCFSPSEAEYFFKRNGEYEELFHGKGNIPGIKAGQSIGLRIPSN
jgi:hypothetical protein